MLLQKRTDTRGVGISSKCIYLLTTTPSSHTHRFHPFPLATPASCSPHPLATPIHSTHSPQLSSILLTCAKFKVWMTIVESGWNVWVWLLGVVVRRYSYYLSLLLLYLFFFAAASLLFVHKKFFFSFFIYKVEVNFLKACPHLHMNPHRIRIRSTSILSALESTSKRSRSDRNPPDPHQEMDSIRIRSRLARQKRIHLWVCRNIT